MALLIFTNVTSRRMNGNGKLCPSRFRQGITRRPAEMGARKMTSSSSICVLSTFVAYRSISACPSKSVDEGAFEDGFGFDGSSIQGFQAIHESDMILLADLSTAYVDPFFQYPTLAMYCDAHDPTSRAPYELDARGVAKRAEAYMANSDIADIAYFGPEAEFFMFDNVQYSTSEKQQLLPRRFP